MLCLSVINILKEKHTLFFIIIFIIVFVMNYCIITKMILTNLWCIFSFYLHTLILYY